MYQIYADWVCFYSDISPSEEYKVINPKLTLEANSAGTLELTIPPTNVAYNTIEKLHTTITVYKNDSTEPENELWEGRVIAEKQDFWNNRVLTCEGEMAYFNDTVQPQIVFDKNNKKTVSEYLTELISNHNAKSSYKQFSLGTVTAGPEEERIWEVDYESTMNNISALVDEYGGVFRVRKVNGTRYLDYIDVDKWLEGINTANADANTPYQAATYADMTDSDKIYIYIGNESGYRYGAWYHHNGTAFVTTQLITFGENLIDFTRDWNLTDFATVILPLGKQTSGEVSENLKKYVDVSGLTDDQIEGQYVKNLDAVEDHGWIAKLIKFDDIPNDDDNKGSGTGNTAAKEELLDAAKLYLTNYQFDGMTIEIKAVDLYNLDPINYEEFKMYDAIHVISVPHGLDRWFTITKMEIPLDEPANTTYSLSKTDKQTISSIAKKFFRNAY